ncbi:MAG: hypothetical protein ALAOOOJD_01377 [bacterium]|nr:hypothetical protein [bacterium]
MIKADAQLVQPAAAGGFGQLAGAWAAVGKFLSVAIQFGLLVFLSRQFQVENQVFYEKIMPLAFGGFLMHYFLPLRYRLPFFIVLSFGGIYLAFGLPNGLWLVGIGLALIGICHLPVAFVVRAGLLLAGGVGLALLRIGQIKVAWAGAVLPILASMFMFRLMIYFYDLKHGLVPTKRLASTLAYFFLLPNVVFPLFPVVDYSTFCQTYYDSDRQRIYQKGIYWMFRGVVLLILYRYVNYYWAIAADEVVSLRTLIQYMISNMMVLLRVSGQFHLIVGMLHLFGFNLPETMHNYFLASSFTDFWRRANIYWKDFMQKVFFYPFYIRLRQRGESSGLFLAMALVFILTWLFHAYQWFWIKGSFLFSAPDVLYWSGFGLIVIANSLYEAKHGRKRILKKPSWNWREIMVRTLRTVGVFAVIAILWSLWISPSIADWLALLSGAGVTLQGVIVACLLATGVFLVAIIVLEKLSWRDAAAPDTEVPFFRPALLTGVPMLALCLIGNPDINTHLGEKTPALVRDLQTARLNRHDEELLTRGYYEDINQANQFNTQLGDIYMKRADNWPTLRETPAGRLTGDFMRDEIVPSKRIVFHGAQLSTNRWGMRDKEYEKEKADQTYRIAVLGASHVFGSGVADNETFEWLLEERLNHARNGEGPARYEILNFASPGYSPLQELVVLEKKALDFKPDALFYIATPREDISSLRHLAATAIKGVAMPYDYLAAIAQKAAIDSSLTEDQAMKRLKPYGNEMLGWLYARFAEICRQHSIQPIYVYTPVVHKLEKDAERDAYFMGVARENGFVIIDISDAYENQNKDSLRVAEWDWHPNAEGHRLLADRLYQTIQENRELLDLEGK